MKLKKINLKKTVIKEDITSHPDISLKKWYLAKINNCFYAGHFDMQWYGLNFNGWCGGSKQFDPPGVNSSDWQELYEIVRKR